MSTIGISESRAHLLSERLAAVIKEHYAQEVQHENQEMESLRREVLQLRGDVTRLQQEIPQKIVDMDWWNTDGATDDLQQGSRSPIKDRPVSLSMNGGVVAGDIDSAARQRCPTQPEEMDMERDMRLRFDNIAGSHNGIDVSTLEHYLTQHLSANDNLKKKEMQRYRIAVHKLKRKLAYPLSTKEEKVATGRIDFAAFEFLMTQDPENMKELVGDQVADSLADLRSALIDDVIVNQIAKSCHVNQNEVEEHPVGVDRKARLLTYIEPISAVVTMLNSLSIGLSLDIGPEWDGWFLIECGFSTFFFIELFINSYARGCSDYLFGQAWYWSWFDVIIVSCAAIDLLFACLEKAGVGDHRFGALVDVEVTRLFRLIKITRITRVLRLLRLRVFKELSIMVNGVVSSLRTIFWAVVVLSVCVYMIGVFMRQIIDPESPWECEAKFRDTSGKCSENEMRMIDFGKIMFGSVPRSMAALFLCFTDGCSSPDGTPFIWLLWETYGVFMVIFYLSAFIFVSFGVFNLIMAMVVENTIATAVQQDAERLFGQHTGNVRKAQQLHALLTKYVKATPAETSQAPPKRGLRGRLGAWRAAGKVDAGQRGVQSDYLHLEITHDEFEEMMQDSSVIELLEDLNISYISRKQLFEILDADASGFLSICEVVDGIMKLRGPPDKGDIVGICLAVRQLQMQMSSLEHQVKKGKEPAITPSRQ